MSGKITKNEAEWRQQLTPEQYRILREKGTEPAFTGALWDSKISGTYRCAGCGQELFRSETKFESHSGWPSFHDPIAPDRITTESDDDLGMIRTEVMCSACDGHLGHVFEDGPPPTGLRYCMNSASMTIAPDSTETGDAAPEDSG